MSPPANLADFARVCDLVAGTTRKLEKQKHLAGYLASLADEDLPRAIRFLDGRVFSRTDERVLNVSGARLLEVVLPLIQLDYARFRPVAIRRGEIGEALAELWPASHGLRRESVTLAHVESLLHAVALDKSLDPLRELFRKLDSPREVAYVCKIILSDMRTGVREGLLIAAVAEAFSRDEDAVRRALMLVGDLDEIAWLAKSDRLSEAKFTPFRPLQFMLATPLESAAEAFDSPRVLFAEPKLDGIRAQLHKRGGRIEIFTRTLDRTDESFPDIVKSASTLKRDLVLDGEIVPIEIDRTGREKIAPFARLQKRLGRKADLAAAVAKLPAVFIAFDLLWLDGELLIDRPLVERRALLDALSRELRVIESTRVNDAAEAEREFERARSAGYEGLVLKDPDSVYSPGRRGQAWMKRKGRLPTLDCVVTVAEMGHGKRRGQLSDYTFAVWSTDPNSEDAKLLEIGKAYSGLTDAEIAALTERFKSISLRDNGRRFEVKPEVVLEIAFDSIQKSKRHQSGFALRFPRILRVRDDRKPEDADTVSRVAAIYHSNENAGRSPGDSQLSLFDL